MAKRTSKASKKLTAEELSTLDTLIKDIEGTGARNLGPDIWWTAIVRQLIRQFFLQRLVLDRITFRLRQIQGDPGPEAKVRAAALDEVEQRLEQMTRMPTLQELKELRKLARGK